ncbi:MAG: hypothetical protein AMXMBFR84_39620 [Candidatus Hydrogenedentota bacterium]
MTRRDLMGVFFLVTLFIVLIVGLVLTFQPKGEGNDPSESVFVQQRVRNLQKQ